MNKNLLIIGAGALGIVAKEIAESMGIFEKIAFVDDEYETTPNGIAVIGKVCDVDNLVSEYYNIIVALPNPEYRLQLIKKLEEETPCRIVTLVPPGTKVGCGIVYKRDEIKPEDFFFDPKRWQEHLMTLTVKVPKGGPEAVNGKEYSFEVGV